MLGSAATNLSVQVFVWKYFSFPLGICLEADGWVMIILCLMFKGFPDRFPAAVPFYMPPEQCCGVPIPPHPRQHLVFPVPIPVFVSHRDRREVEPAVVLRFALPLD